MRLLLDTQVVIWLAKKPTTLSAKARTAIADNADELHVSLASAWKYENKRRKYPRQLPEPFEILLSPAHRRLDLGFDLYRYAASLPLIHGDPFDRLLIAQAIDLGLTLVTADKAIHRYPVPTLW